MNEPGFSHLNIDQLFHVPARLGIATALYARRRGMSFSELKKACELSDGNQSRHISRMEQASVVLSEKTFIDRIPRTTITLTEEGRARFERYIEHLRSIVEAQEIVPDLNDDALPRGTVYD